MSSNLVYNNLLLLFQEKDIKVKEFNMVNPSQLTSANGLFAVQGEDVHDAKQIAMRIWTMPELRRYKPDIHRIPTSSDDIFVVTGTEPATRKDISIYVGKTIPRLNVLVTDLTEKKNYTLDMVKELHETGKFKKLTSNSEYFDSQYSVRN